MSPQEDRHLPGLPLAFPRRAPGNTKNLLEIMRDVSQAPHCLYLQVNGEIGGLVPSQSWVGPPPPKDSREIRDAEVPGCTSGDLCLEARGVLSVSTEHLSCHPSGTEEAGLQC